VARGGSVEQITDTPDDTSRFVSTSNAQARAAATLEAIAACLPCNIRPNDLVPTGAYGSADARNNRRAVWPHSNSSANNTNVAAPGEAHFPLHEQPPELFTTNLPVWA
jgi:hypothetical protein